MVNLSITCYASNHSIQAKKYRFQPEIVRSADASILASDPNISRDLEGRIGGIGPQELSPEVLIHNRRCLMTPALAFIFPNPASRAIPVRRTSLGFALSKSQQEASSPTMSLPA